MRTDLQAHLEIRLQSCPNAIVSLRARDFDAPVKRPGNTPLTVAASYRTCSCTLMCFQSRRPTGLVTSHVPGRNGKIERLFPEQLPPQGRRGNPPWLPGHPAQSVGTGPRACPDTRCNPPVVARGEGGFPPQGRRDKLISGFSKDAGIRIRRACPYSRHIHFPLPPQPPSLPHAHNRASCSPGCDQEDARPPEAERP